MSSLKNCNFQQTAIAAISAITAITRPSVTASAASALPMDNVDSELPNQAMDDRKTSQLQKTIAQIEVNPIHLDGNIAPSKHPPTNNTARAKQPSNGINACAILNSTNAINLIPDTSNIAKDVIELKSFETNGRKIEVSSSKPSSQSPRTLPRSHASHRRQLHTDIHSASASPSIPSRNNHPNYTQGQFNNSFPTATPQMCHGARSSSTSVQSPAGIQSINSDSPSLVCGQDSNDSSSLGMGTLCRKEAMQQKVISLLTLLGLT